MGSENEIPAYTAYLENLGIAAKVTDCPGSFRHPSAYTHIFLDYGGLNQPGNSLFQAINEEVSEIVENHPSIEFIIISVMGKSWFEQELNIDAPNLTFMSHFRDEKELIKILNQ